MSHWSRGILRTFWSWVTSMTDGLATDSPPGVCWVQDLPPEILQIITDYLNVHDLLAFSRTCQTFHTLINDDRFWSHRIHRQFPPSVAQLYTCNVFQSPEIIETTDEPQPTGFQHVRNDGELDRLAIYSATHYNDQAIERRQAKMHVSKEEFLADLQYFQFKTPNDCSQVPFMKLVYFYLIDRKRRAAVHMDVVHLTGSYLTTMPDSNSLTGRIIQLRSVCWLEITGRFEQQIMPGNYEASWRMKSHPENVNLNGETEFLIVPSHGTLLVKRIADTDFRNYALEHGNRWFTVNIGQVRIYEPSRVFVGIRNWNNGNWKSGIAWDCLELRLIP